MHLLGDEITRTLELTAVFIYSSELARNTNHLSKAKKTYPIPYTSDDSTRDHLSNTVRRDLDDSSNGHLCDVSPRPGGCYEEAGRTIVVPKSTVFLRPKAYLCW